MIRSARFPAWKIVSIVLVALLTYGVAPSQTASSAGFVYAPNGAPVAGQVVQFNDASAGAAGVFHVTMTATGAGGANVVEQDVVVSAADTLQLATRGGHPFTVALTATDQRTGRTAPGQAIPQNDLFGYFSIPALTGNADNPEVFVKILDGTAVNGEFWVFYGHLTDLVYDLTVTEVATGFSKTYHKDAGNSAGGFDTSGFHAATPTPAPTLPAPTPTPTPAPTQPAIVTVNLVASDFQWDFDGGGDSFTFRVGQPYQLRIRRSNGTHGFSGIAALGCSGASLSSTAVCNFTPTAAQIGTHGFACTISSCGVGHSSMLTGRAIVAR